MSNTSPAKTGHHSYISSIDGLRAVAVLLVLLFHLDLQFAHSGFIGVDAFFVISGFLITRNITQSVERGSFSFLDFYFRRAARLMPAVLTVVLLTLIGGYFFLSAQDYNRLGFSSFLSSISLSNIFFWTEAGYFAQASDTKPLLHTWSLAVEEQFYLVWPIFLFACLASGRKLLVISMAALGLLSFVAAVYFHRENPDMVFFLAPFRVFQFAIGGLISFLPAWKFRDRLSIIGILSVLSLFGLAAALPDDLSGFQHVVTVMLLPALLTGAFLFTAKSNVQERIFASPILKYLGERSYAIYLAHWPIIVYWNMATDYVLSPFEQAGLFVASVILGELLHQCVEKPFRLSRSASPARVLRTKFFLLAMAFMSGTLAMNVTYFNGFAKEGAANSQAISQGPLTASLGTDGVADQEGRCFMRPQDAPELYGVERCATAPVGKMPKVLVFGDSFAGDMYVALKGGFKAPYFGHYIIPGCPIESPSKVAANKNQCQAHYKNAYENVITKNRFDYVVLVANWTKVSDKDIVETKKYLESLGVKVVTVGLRPRFRERVPDILQKAGESNAARTRANVLVNQDFIKRADAMKISQGGADDYVDLMDLLCPETCDIETPNGDLIYRDDSHFTLKASSWVGREIRNSYPDLFNQSVSP
ncbi:acyltransferase family protein [Litorimonas cladophorae]|nr:acyltransferase family protein [Litorimonas cladophorae]